MEPPSLEQEYPRFGREPLDHAHAPYAIVLLLQRICVPEWAPTLLAWLGRYDGLEEHLQQEEDPACCTRDVLMQHAMQCSAAGSTDVLSPEQKHARIELVVQDLLQLSFVRATAYWGRLMGERTTWQPLAQPWMSFLDIVPSTEERGDRDEGLYVWTRDAADATQLKATRALLMAGSPLHRQVHRQGRGDDDRPTR
jgi:hypothetical protein